MRRVRCTDQQVIAMYESIRVCEECATEMRNNVKSTIDRYVCNSNWK